MSSVVAIIVSPLFFNSSEANRSVSVTIADSNVIPIQDGLAFIAVREMQQEDQDGIINFSIKSSLTFFFDVPFRDRFGPAS